jgi:hypothetical protein
MISTERLKLNLIQQIATTDDDNLLASLTAVVAGKAAVDIEAYNKELEEAEARIDAGDFFSQEQVKLKFSI